MTPNPARSATVPPGWPTSPPRRGSARRRSAGCSTASRASPPATRRSVLAALDVLGYERPQRLRQRSDGLVGLVTPELDNPIFPAFAQAIEQALTRHGYTPVLCTQMPGGAHRGRVHRAAGGARRGRHHLRLRAARRHHRRIGPLRPAAAARACRSSWSTATRPTSTRPVHLPRRPGGGAAGRARIWSIWGTRGSAWPWARAVRAGAAARSRASRRRWRSCWGVGEEADELISALAVPVEGGQAAAGALLDRGCTGDRVRERHDGAGRDPGGPAAGSGGARRRLGGRLRRLAADRLHRPAADHRAATRAGDGQAAVRTLLEEIGGAPAKHASSSSCRSWWSAAPRAPAPRSFVDRRRLPAVRPDRGGSPGWRSAAGVPPGERGVMACRRSAL